MSIDTIGNFLTSIRNSVTVSKRKVITRYSKINFSIAQILKQEGFVNDVRIIDKDNFKAIEIDLRYIDGQSVIHEIDRVSTPGARCFTRVSHIEPVIGNLGISILSTNKGLMTNKQARELSVGGEILCNVW